MAARFDNSAFEIKDNFTDVSGHWAEDYIHEAAAHGWIRGYEDGSFRPDRLITRAEAMTLINRVLNRVPENTSDLLDGMVKWPDNADTTAWYYLPVQEATNSHYYDRKANSHEKWTSLREVRDWSEFED
ncbi:MAG: S-layer homology domain-containing protein [Oscillospiraceae bacterium]|nr:S-layer homology domain-containing protein [Oscillospiraceae bacterium]